ncbi:unnamed protein product [Closterium sp. NIES-53]
MTTPSVLTFDAEGRAIDFDVWVDDLLLFLQCDRADGLSLFDLTSGASPAPAATEDATVRSHAQTLYDAVIARYSTPATAALSRLILPYLFPDLASFATVADLITHLRSSDARFRAALPVDRSVRRLPPAGDVALARAKGAGAVVEAAGAVEAAVEAAEEVRVVAGVVAGVEVSAAAVEAEAVVAAATVGVAVAAEVVAAAAEEATEVVAEEAPMQTLHMDVWGPARVRGQGHERYFLLVVDDYSRYTTVFPLRSKEAESSPPAFCEPTRLGFEADSTSARRA